MKYFVVADVHGFFDELMRSLDEKGFDKNNPDHTFVSLGDLMDRGRKPLECLKFVNSLERKILVRGNHEDLLDECLNRGYPMSHDISNGTATTIEILYNEVVGEHTYQRERIASAVDNGEELNKYRKSLVDYAEVGDKIFVHGWIPCDSDERSKYKSRDVKYSFDPEWRTGDWERARWINGMDAWNQGVRVPDKTIYCGHWHASWGNSKLHNDGLEFPNLRSTNPEHRKANFDPFIDDGIVACDTCTAYSGRVNCVVTED